MNNELVKHTIVIRDCAINYGEYRSRVSGGVPISEHEWTDAIREAMALLDATTSERSSSMSLFKVSVGHIDGIGTVRRYTDTGVSYYWLDDDITSK